MPHEQKGAQALNNDEISQKIVALLSEIEAQSYLIAPFREPTMDSESRPSAKQVFDLSTVLFLRIGIGVRLTGLSRSTIYRMTAEERFPAPVRLANRIVAWRRTDLERWSEAQTCHQVRHSRETGAAVEPVRSLQAQLLLRACCALEFNGPTSGLARGYGNKWGDDLAEAPASKAQRHTKPRPVRQAGSFTRSVKEKSPRSLVTGTGR